MKICIECGDNLSLDKFGKVKNYKDGLDSTCKHCRSIQKKKKRKEKGYILKKMYMDELINLPNLNFNISDFIDFFFYEDTFTKSYDLWEKNNFMRRYKPTLFFDKDLTGNYDLSDFDVVCKYGSNYIGTCITCGRKRFLFVDKTGLELCAICLRDKNFE